ncbi:hypothetical protein ASE01_23610 [Nocardioides sp. Root190]|uniref:hypothetical protein n=1 Tax=Nocardioides sp. Root190 TaxID=1736488 RepID=UPI0006FDD90D|nr:hypothetical protein [Nocardioides sp. Root190]KRB78924.1 hypothetical protein ASE01_23610 [Nocardioides sp. Root190]
MKVPSLLLAAAVVVSMLSGCSDDKAAPEEPEADGSSALAKAEFIEQADAICRATNERIQEAGEALGDSPEPADAFQHLEEVVLPELSAQAKALRELTPPDGDVATIEEMLDALDAALDAAGEGSGDDDPLVTANQIALDYGFGECGKNDE